MSQTSRGSERYKTSKPRKTNRTSAKRYHTEHDIYAAYCEDDQHDVRPILDALKNQHLTVYDPHEDALPNATVFKAWLEQGIYKSSITLIFLTKNFVKHNYCKFQADHAVIRYTKTKGGHRVLVVMLQSCKVPKNLHHFNCVYAWKFREEPTEQYIKISKAISAPKVKFRRGSVLWYGLSTNTAKIANQTICDIQTHKESKAEIESRLAYRHLLFNLGRVKFALENCELKCTSENCAFRCSGDRIIDLFFTHVKVCKFQKVRCRFCRQTILRKNHQKHEQTTCKRRHVACPNESCTQKLTANEMYKHARVCSYKEEACPNNIYGCTGVFAHKDKAKHLEICVFEKVVCKRCNLPFFQVDLDTHDCEVNQLNHIPLHTVSREQERFQCQFEGCAYTGPRNDLVCHQLYCEFRLEQCADCGMRLPVRDLVWHRRQCDKIVACQLCHQLVPSSSKLTHDRWLCTGQNIRELCEICHTCVSSARKESHVGSCQPCVSDTHASQGGVSVLSTAGTTAVQTSRTKQDRFSAGFEQSEEWTGWGTIHIRATWPPPRTSPSFEQLLLDTAPVHIPRQGLIYQEDTGSSYGSFVKPHPLNRWTAKKRYNWRILMDGIERNKLDLQKVMNACDG